MSYNSATTHFNKVLEEFNKHFKHPKNGSLNPYKYLLKYDTTTGPSDDGRNVFVCH